MALQTACDRRGTFPLLDRSVFSADIAHPSQPKEAEKASGLSTAAIAGIVVGRFFSGFLSAIPTIVVAGSIEDLYNSKDRIWMIFLWAMVANMGMCVRPIISTYIAEHLGW